MYDLTDYVIRHPGGNEILRACGTDATSLFNSRQSADGRERVGSGTPHSQAAAEQLARLKIGTLTKKIVTEHGGRLWLTSRSGKGTTIYMALPDAGKAEMSSKNKRA